MHTALYLITQLVKKDIETRYKGSILGLFWSFITPLLMLIIYTFIFSEIFQAKWGILSNNKFMFALTLYCGLNIINTANDILSRSTTLIASHTNYVKKIIFPLHILPFVLTFSSLFNCIIGYAILITANILLRHTVSFSIWLLPIMLIPFVLLVLGLSYILSAVSVFIKDLTSLIGIILMLIMYTSPVFYPLEAVPERFSFICKLNPFTFIIENIRSVVLYNSWPSFKRFCCSMVISVVILVLGYTIFRRLKEGFADVL
jgi:lipopolysaccharide transport system permease protein